MTEWTGIIIMKINNFGYLLREGFCSVFLHGFMSFAAVCVTVACLLIVGSFSILMYDMNLMVENLNQTNEMMVYVDYQLPEAEAKSVGTKLNLMDNVYNASYVPREEALASFVGDHADSESFSGVDYEDLDYRFRVVLEDPSRMSETEEAIRQLDGVINVQAANELAAGFGTIQQVLRIASIGIIAVLLTVSLLIISNTVKLAMYDRRHEIAIMKMVGATNGFIRFPFVIEGFLLGIIGAAAAFGLEWLMYDQLILRVNEVDTFQLFTFVPFRELLVPMVIVFSAAGLFVGIVGSLTSIRKFLDV